MRELIVFNQVSMDGYFADSHGDMSWAHKKDPEWRAFVEDNASSGGELLFGRITYELMVSHWPTVGPRDDDAKLAERMIPVELAARLRNLAGSEKIAVVVAPAGVSLSERHAAKLRRPLENHGQSDMEQYEARQERAD